ncbi:putative epoxide hydrolase [Lachnellula hyalina]|uniref:Putative epoxide hydrolase n=1 Tax=Lachnellula hyalina TaxID=1316788 RepID=A0A8H8R4U1_9HELO|nr:putative epoxide hydrolase [Lachnellula hyalina]TVY28439.1 putative epoxide hydrolase [Lachnellula hyalina]
MSLPTPMPFKINISESLLSFISHRVSTARIPSGFDHLPGEEWAYGPPPSVMAHLKEYWTNTYDWRAVEARINGHLTMFTLPIKEGSDEIEMHFVHHRSEREGAIPLLFQHGWPGSFLEVDKIIDLLTTPSDPTAQAYHVVAPSIPGFTFSSAPKSPGFNLKNMASINNNLMHSLGYFKYMVQGGDWGSMIARVMVNDYPESCIAIHVNMLLASPPVWYKQPLSWLQFLTWATWTAGNENGMLGRAMWWMKKEGGYMEIQGTKPQTISYALADSPFGMLAWIRDKLEHLIDDDFTFDDETAITWAMLYIIPQNSAHAHIYTNFKGEKQSELHTYLLSKKIPSNVDFGVSIFPKEVSNVPRFWAEACLGKKIVFWKEHAKGGHFPAVERPEVLVEDVRAFTKAVEKGRMAELRSVGKLNRS